MDLVYNTPQDKLLIMLLERINVMEEKIEKQNVILEKLLTFSTCKYFCINMSKKDVYEKLVDIINYIDNKIPICKVKYTSWDKLKSYTLTLETESKWIFNTIQEQLSFIDKDLNFSNPHIDIFKANKIDNDLKIIAEKDTISGKWKFELPLENLNQN